MSDCICYITPEKYWTTHYGAVEPGSQMEPNPECPEHFPESSKPMSENMNTPSDPRVGEIQARLDAATPGPWYVDDEEQTVRAREYAGEIVYDRSAEHPSEWTKNFKPTAEFIAAAPADVAYLLAELRDRDEKFARVEALHSKSDWEVGSPRPVGALEGGVCAWCGVTYPCATTAALEGK